MIPATTRRVDLAAAALAVALALAPAAYAQVLYGTITGNVTDTTGGALAGATVQVVNVATGVAKDSVSDARAEPSELRESEQQCPGCRHVRVHHADDGRRRAEYPAGGAVYFLIG